MKVEHFSKLVDRVCKVCHKHFEGARREVYCSDDCKSLQRKSVKAWKKTTVILEEAGHSVKKQKTDYVITVNPSHFKNDVRPLIRIPDVLPQDNFEAEMYHALKDGKLVCDLREVTPEIIVNELPDEILSYILAMYFKCTHCGQPTLKDETYCAHCKKSTLPF